MWNFFWMTIHDLFLRGLVNALKRFVLHWDLLNKNMLNYWALDDA